MIVVCPACQSSYKFDESKLADRPKVKTRCSKCGGRIEIENTLLGSSTMPPDLPAAPPPAPRPEPSLRTQRTPVAAGDALELVVIGDDQRLPPGWRALLPGRTGHVSGTFRALPAARRYLAMGAGHNLVYELLEAGLCFAAVPCERRYDDQFRRADRLGIGIHARDELARWLEAR